MAVNNVLRMFKSYPMTWFTVYECKLQGYDTNKEYLDYLYSQGVLYRCLKRTYKHWMSYAYRWNHNAKFVTKMLEDLENL